MVMSGDVVSRLLVYRDGTKLGTIQDANMWFFQSEHSD